MKGTPVNPPTQGLAWSLSRATTTLLLLGSLALTACGGSEPAADAPEAAAAGDTPTQSGSSPAASAPADAAPEPESAGPAIPGVSTPRVRFAAFGPAPGTYGPRCGTGIEVTSSDVFRITPPANWVYRGTGGGSGADDISFELNGTRVTVDLYADRGELGIEDDFEDRGATGLTVELPGASVPLHEVFVDGRTGYGILFVPWMVDLPLADDPEGTILVTSREPGLVDAETAAAVLETVRVERCAAISRTLVWGPMSRRQLVPEFEGGDPLGKTRPDEPHPEYVPGESPLLTFSEAQVAYLLPVAGEVAECVAGLVREDAANDPILHFKVLMPSGTQKEELAAYVARCSA